MTTKYANTTKLKEQSIHNKWFEKLDYTIFKRKQQKKTETKIYIFIKVSKRLNRLVKNF